MASASSPVISGHVVPVSQQALALAAAPNSREAESLGSRIWSAIKRALGFLTHPLVGFAGGILAVGAGCYLGMPKKQAGLVALSLLLGSIFRMKKLREKQREVQELERASSQYRLSFETFKRETEGVIQEIDCSPSLEDLLQQVEKIKKAFPNLKDSFYSSLGISLRGGKDPFCTLEKLEESMKGFIEKGCMIKSRLLPHYKFRVKKMIPDISLTVENMLSALEKRRALVQKQITF